MGHCFREWCVKRIVGREACQKQPFFLKWRESRSVMSDSLQPHGLYNPWNSPGQNTGVGSLSLLQGIFPTQGSNPGLPHCRWILYQLSYQGSYTYTYILSFFISFSQNSLFLCYSQAWVLAHLRRLGFYFKVSLAAFHCFVDIWNHEWYTKHSFVLYLLRNNFLGSFFTAPLLYMS